MVTNGNENLLGLYINEDNLRVVTKEASEEKPRISNIFSGKLKTPLNIEAIKNRGLIPEISQNIEELLSKNITIAGNVNVAIDKSLVLLKKVTIDSDLTESEISDHVEWELEQFLISSRDYYNVGYEKGARGNNGTQNIIVACARLSVVDYIKDVFNQTPYSLTGMDINIFSASRALKALYQENLTGYTVLLTVEDSAIDIVILNDGKILTWGAVDKTPENQDIFYSQNEALVDYLRTELSTLLLGMEEIHIQTFFIDGNISTVFKAALQEEYDMAAILKVDIFQGLSETDRESFPVGPEGLLAAMGMNGTE